jgi:Cupin
MKTSDSSRSADRTGSTRREFLAGTSLAALGVTSVLTRGAASLAAATASAAPSEGPSEELQDFIYDLEKGTKGWTGPGGSAKEATVAEFPLSQSIAGVSMRLDVGGFRELHWHAIAAEWAYVLEGRVRTTVISPDGRTETDDSIPEISGIFLKGMDMPYSVWEINRVTSSSDATTVTFRNLELSVLPIG